MFGKFNWIFTLNRFHVSVTIKKITNKKTNFDFFQRMWPKSHFFCSFFFFLSRNRKKLYFFFFFLWDSARGQTNNRKITSIPIYIHINLIRIELICLYTHTYHTLCSQANWKFFNVRKNILANALPYFHIQWKMNNKLSKTKKSNT